MLALCGVLASLFGGIGADLPDAVVFESFDSGTLPPIVQLNHATAKVVSKDARRVLQVYFQKVDWPNVFFSAGDKPWDWSSYQGIAVDIFNPEEQPLSVCMRVDNEGADGVNNCLTHCIEAPPKQWTTMMTRFVRNPKPFWGMRGVPVWGPLPSGKEIDLTRIVAFQIFLPRPTRPHRLVIDNIRLFGKGEPLEDMVSLPFVDRFGQYKHEDWPCKIHSEEDLVAEARKEEKTLARFSSDFSRNPFRGWAKGPKLEATGWFRTEKLDGKWWLVTPDGRLFFSLGMDCLGTWERTFVEKRDDWFEWLPNRNIESPYQELYQFAENPHSMADILQGGGWTFSFYGANLIRKYGGPWKDRWRQSAYGRLDSWGFNTIGAWAQEDVLEKSPLPFTAITGIHGEVRRIEAGSGYWSKMYDVYDPSFAVRVDSSVGPMASKYASNPLCIGFFVDNELGWEDPRRATLSSPTDQPCRKMLIQQLMDKYGSSEQLCRAWEIPETDWDHLRLPSSPNATCRSDMDRYVYDFAKTYFLTVRNVVKKYAPHHLYLGCRFAGKPEEPVIRACAEVADVISVNLYNYTLDAAEWTGQNDYNKPVLVGEFHFGALDRGMFHPGLCPTRDQTERARAYRRYVESVASCPVFVGCHWFQYIDEPITGRWFDGENYNIGFVSVTDSPYPELVTAARRINHRIYDVRYKR
ncbi:MAG TPA: beta-galactosidase [Candidatus Hydrogenedentes bacterium]|nr:beta-galactosidase [Candidatus Hydrogenedentota bacterium]HOL77380.1 beta-galactosidase [Candidatus Hydrogenedentota bacterium]HPO84802.1 beta-galactosidase [Candidatus Hydrogenedentota bacterium]